MKKTLIFAAVAAMFVMASCQKDSENEEFQESKSLVFSATIDNGITRTTINTDASDETNRGKVSWETTDEITISDGSQKAVYKVKSIDATSGKAIFEYKSGATLATSGVTYTATYGSDPSTTQTYSATAGNLPMSATSTTTNLQFTTTCGLLKLNLTDASNTISKVIVSGGTPRASYTLNCDNVGISGGKDFYVALPAGDYNHIVCVNSAGAVCSKVATKAFKIAANDIQPISFSNMTFDTHLLPYEFSVASDKQVLFTNGNLYWNESAFKFETNQTDYPSSWSTSHVGHFYWSKTASVAYAQTYSGSDTSTGDKFFCGEDNKLTVDGQSSLYALSSAEWEYLFKSRTNASSLYKCGVTVGSVTNCLIIAPDNYSGTALNAITDWSLSNINTLGLVCLPAAGYRDGKNPVSAGNGYYWSATPHESNAGSAYRWYFDSSKVYKLDMNTRSNGFSIRLVK